MSEQPASSSNGHHATAASSAPSSADPTGKRRTPWPLVIIATLFVVVPFLAWYGTWFGRTLSDEKIGEYLRHEKPRHVQHALSQIAERIDESDNPASAQKFYPQVVSLVSHPVTDVRMTAAWVMGQDNRSQAFHEALVGLLTDREPIVRRNAALALVRFNDGRGRAELRAMLQPYTVLTDREGTAQTVLTAGTSVNREAMIAKYRDASGRVGELRAPLPGKIERVFLQEGDKFGAGAEVCVLRPDSKSVWEALRALYLVGETEDLADVERYTREPEGASDHLRRQAALTAEAVKRRSAQNSN